ncbi:MAG: hypothetical protein HY321_06640 [Armatimonadetes bacterium]|nr:hypothetical protein [Armatimonadota bacterium]
MQAFASRSFRGALGTLLAAAAFIGYGATRTPAAPMPGARAAAPPSLTPLAGSPLQPRLDETFPSAVREDLQTVADEVAAVVSRLLPGPPPAFRPIICTVDPNGPLTDVTTDPSRYRITLTVTGRYYAQLVYQLSHELAHVMMDPRRTNGSVETVATAVSIRALMDIADRWQVQPPHPRWQAYVPRFREYALARQAEALRNFPAPVRAAAYDGRWDEVALYLRYRRPESEGRPYNRDLHHLAAMALCAEPVPWAEFVGLGTLTDPSPERDPVFRSDLQLDLSRVPLCLRRIGIGRATALAAAEFAARPAVNGGFLFFDGGHWVWLGEMDPAARDTCLPWLARLGATRLLWEPAVSPMARGAVAGAVPGS